MQQLCLTCVSHFGDLEQPQRRDPLAAVVPECDADLALGRDLVDGGLVVLAVALVQRLALLANLERKYDIIAIFNIISLYFSCLNRAVISTIDTCIWSQNR